MTWVEPEHTPAEVDAAGHILIDLRRSTGRDVESAFRVISNWRSAHNFPLNTFQVSLRRKAKQIEHESLVAQRLKRLSSITSKLKRFQWLTLSKMQDIAGCRAVVGSVEKVVTLVEAYKGGDLKHRLDKEDDYITRPKASGYRGYHLIYQYRSDRKKTYNGLKIELQFRSPLQHAWATAVETVDAFTRQALKSSRGEVQWLRFFSLMGSAIALREGCPPVPGTPETSVELVREIRRLARQLRVEARLTAFSEALQPPEEYGLQGAKYFLMVLDSDARSMTITGFGPQEGQVASRRYMDVEREHADDMAVDAVLVSVDSLAELRRAYPNYFLDTSMFLEALRAAAG